MFITMSISDVSYACDEMPCYVSHVMLVMSYHVSYIMHITECCQVIIWYVISYQAMLCKRFRKLHYATLFHAVSF